MLQGRSVLVVAACCLLPGCGAGPGPGGGPDQGAGDGDAAVAEDGRVVAPDGGLSCTTHYDCPQTWFCYDKTCIRDPLYLVFHCGKRNKSGADTCPPGRRCVNKSGAKSICAPSTSYPCKDACDCGPAHCCIKLAGIKGKRCVKHTEDPWSPGGKTVGGGSCALGQDATYCASDPACHVGLALYGEQGWTEWFVSHDRSTGKAVSGCGGGASCHGTACNCKAGQSCVDTVVPQLQPGLTCGLHAGGSCVSNAVAEAMFGFKPDDLLPCCSRPGCAKGQRCDAGWTSHRKGTFARVVGTCGSCGNGTCDQGEYPKTCPQDCRCGDGICHPSEPGTCADCVKACGNKVCDAHETTTTCKADCSCGNGTCDVGETTVDCPQDCRCGDGICSPEEACPQDCACPTRTTEPEAYRVCGDKACGGTGCWDHERCDSCPGDCGACRWTIDVAFGRQGAVDEGLASIWGRSAGDVWAVGLFGIISRFDGTTWRRMPSPTSLNLNSVWVDPAGEVWAVGRLGTIVHFDGKALRLVGSPTTVALNGVWGSSASDVWAVGAWNNADVILRYDGKVWKQVASPAGASLQAVWGSSAGNVWAVGDKILRYDGKSWISVANPTTNRLHGLWGSSAGDIWAVGGWSPGVILHYDGTTWKQVVSPVTHGHLRVWGSAANDVWAVGDKGVIHYDGQAWKTVSSVATSDLSGVWGSSAGDVWITGTDAIFHYDGKALKQVAAAFKGSIQDLWGFSASDVWAVGQTKSNQGAIFHHDGAAWKQLAFQSAGLLRGVWGASASDVWAVGSSALGTTSAKSQPVFARFDGKTWQQVACQTCPAKVSHLNAVWGSSASDIWAVGDHIELSTMSTKAVVVHYDGNAWTPQASGPAASTLDGLWASSAGDVWALKLWSIAKFTTIPSVVYHLGGGSWSDVTAPLLTEAGALWGSSASDLWAVGRKGAVAHYNGTSWSQAAPVTSSTLGAVHGSSASDVWAVGQYWSGSLDPDVKPPLVHYDGKGWINAWPRLRTTSDICLATRYASPSSVWVAPSGQAFVGGGKGRILQLKPLP